MGLAVGPRAHVPVSHNRRVTNVLLIAPLRTEMDGRGGRRAERERKCLAMMRDDGSKRGGGEIAAKRDGTRRRRAISRLEITREEGDAAPGSGEYAFWITGGCPRGLSRCLPHSVRFSSLSDAATSACRTLERLT